MMIMLILGLMMFLAIVTIVGIVIAVACVIVILAAVTVLALLFIIVFVLVVVVIAPAMLLWWSRSRRDCGSDYDQHVSEQGVVITNAIARSLKTKCLDVPQTFAEL